MSTTAKHAGGRPTDFNGKYIVALYKYLQEATPQNMTIPTVEGFALKIGVTKKTIYNWSKKHKEFLHALRILKMTQKQELIDTGIFGGKEINANIIALMLKVNHKMIETTKSDITSGGEKLAGLIQVNESKTNS